MGADFSDCDLLITDTDYHLPQWENISIWNGPAADPCHMEESLSSQYKSRLI